MIRQLTEAEIAALPRGLVDAVDVDRVELIGRHHWVSWLAMLVWRGPQIVVRGHQIFWPGLQADYSGDVHRLSMLAHELVHVWQYANGMTLWRYVLREHGVYHYRLDGRPFTAYGYEQQAAMVEDWVRLRGGLKTRWATGPVDAAHLQGLTPFL